jgi:hypothetical protein
MLPSVTVKIGEGGQSPTLGLGGAQEAWHQALCPGTGLSHSTPLCTCCVDQQGQHLGCQRDLHH